MNSDVIITCAITGDDTKVTKSPHCPITPEQIAASAVDAARAGASIVHIHVRDPETGAFSMATRHYREVVKCIRESGVDVLVNLTCGMGGYIYIGKRGLEDTPAPGSDFVTQRERMRHVIELCEEGLYRPDIATLDCGSLNFGDGNRAYVSTPNYLRKGAAILRDLQVKPELEVFDTGNLWFVKQLIKEELIGAPALIQLCTG
ncbi:MAG TPA: 3-keto-5-aminohexanoate cleavage protein, partial [Steroidobacteraceae bacterium]|nr:3-keto-5-aminohexanoate cleavage protein [Steroidobacteraceae bacterium]